MNKLTITSICLRLMISILFCFSIASCGGGGSGVNNEGLAEEGVYEGEVEGEQLNCIDYDSNTVITLRPGRNISVNQELVMDASLMAESADSTFTWDYGDGSFSASMSGTGLGDGLAVAHFYALPGNYTIKLTVDETQTFECPIVVSGEQMELPPMVSTEPLIDISFNKKSVTNSGNGQVTVSVWDGDGEKSVESSDFVSGIYGDALDLSNGNYLALGNVSTVLADMDSITVSFWFRKASGDALADLAENQRSYLMSWNFPGYPIPTLYSRIENNSVGAGMITDNDDHLGSSGIATAASSYSYTWQHFAMTWDGETLKTYVDGVLKSEDQGSGALMTTSDSLYFGVSDAENTEYETVNRNVHFKGFIDEIKIYNRVLSLEELFIGFELWHSDLHAHTIQPIKVKIPEQYRLDNTNKISATVSDGNSSFDLQLNNITAVLSSEKSAYNQLSEEEVILLNYEELPASDNKYTLSVKILDSNNSKLIERSVSFTKDYDGLPIAGINRYGGFVYSGDNFFPVTCWGLHDHDQYDSLKMLKNWTSNGIDNGVGERWERPVINTGFGHGWGIEYTSELYSVYLDDNQSNGLVAMGPSSWEGVYRDKDQNSDIRNMIEYIVDSKDHLANFMWSWRDEPDLNGVTAEVVRAWTALSHYYDRQHPVTTTLRGRSFITDNSDSFMNTAKSYLARYNAVRFGKITQPLNGVYVTDVVGFDYYPIDWAEPHNFDATVVETINALDNARLFGDDMIPHYNFVETTDIHESEITPYNPQPEQLKMLSWVHLIHGMKALPWFHHHSTTPDENFIVMADIVEAADYFKDILNDKDSATVRVNVEIDLNGITEWQLGSEYETGDLVRYDGKAFISRNDHTSTNETMPFDDDLILTWKAAWKTEARIDIMLKEDDSYIYLFAVRPTEIDTDGNSIGIERDVTFTLSDTSYQSITVWNESRDINITNGAFADSFEPNGVHVYLIEK